MTMRPLAFFFYQIFLRRNCFPLVAFALSDKLKYFILNLFPFCFIGEAKTQTTNLKLNDNKWHKVHLTRADRVLTITIDDGVASRKCS